MFCRNCGMEIRDNNIFCRECGAKLMLEDSCQPLDKPIVRPTETEAVNLKINTVKKNVIEKRTKASKNKKILKGTFLVLALLAVVQLGILLAFISTYEDLSNLEKPAIVDDIEALWEAEPMTVGK